MIEPKDENPKKEAINALNEMFAASHRYRGSGEYLKMMRFISKLPKYSPYNCMLLYEQNPGISYVATPTAWKNKFGRYPKHDARPLIILAPMGPVAFVYDLNDTYGQPVPKELERPFLTEGKISEAIYKRTIYNCSFHGIAVIETLLHHKNAGYVSRCGKLKRYKDVELAPNAQFVIFINKEYKLEDKYSSLAHELGHIFCGHVGISDEAWWPQRSRPSDDVVEIEAESVAYLVCQRKGLKANSDRYLSGFQVENEKEMPVFGFYEILQAVGYIEDMGKELWEKPKKKSRYKKNG